MKVKFMPQNIELDIAPDQSVMDLAHKNGIFIKSICNGVPNCSECRVKVLEGESNVLPPGTKEIGLLGTGYFIDQRRLSCQLKCFGDLTVDLTEQIAKQNSGPKKVLGNKKVDQQTSQAVSGNLIQQEVALFTEAEENQSRTSQQQDRHHEGQRDGQRGGGRDNQQRGGQREQHRDGGQRGGGGNRDNQPRSGGNRDNQQRGGQRDGQQNRNNNQQRQNRPRR